MATTLLYNATLLTQDPAQPMAQALAIRDGRIQAVGSNDDILNLATAQTRKIDLGGRVVIPGFNDAHVHVWKVGHLLTTMLDVRGVTCMLALQSQIQKFAQQLPQGAWFMGRGYNEALMDEKRHPTRHDLDAVLPDRPAYLIRTCAHIAVVNSKALEIAGITAQTQTPPGGVIELGVDGQPNGILHETALGLVFNKIPDPSAQDYERMISAAIQHQIELGITSSTDPGVMPQIMAVYRQMEAAGLLRNRQNVMAIRRPDGGTETLPLPEVYHSDHLRVDTIKFFADGGLSGATAAISTQYPHKDSQGVLRFEADELYELAREAHQQGLRIATHAIGDVAIEVVLSVYERLYQTLSLQGEGVTRGMRHRIEHLGLPTPDQLRRIQVAGIIAVPQTIFIHALGRNFREYVPPAMLPNCYPVRAMLEAGITVALSSDAPVVKDDNPLQGMKAAILRLDNEGQAVAPGQAISAVQALYAYTMGGALASGDSENRGSLTAGKWADLAILSANPLTVDPHALTEIKVEQTYVGGQVVFEA
jgi:hypothetical protein